MKAIILAGGYGTRLGDAAGTLPKPLVKIGDTPILVHILKILAAGPAREFIIALGYKGDMIRDYFLHAANGDLAGREGSCLSVDYSPVQGQPGFRVHLVDTGPDTKTGGRLKRLQPMIQDDEAFLMTYADGVADLDVRALVGFHRAHGRLATVTAVNPPERFGRITLEKDRVTRFNEKPESADNWINGGFFVLEPGVFDYIRDDETVWERGPMEALVGDGELMAYRHRGFWSCMDTPSEQEYLDDLWNTGRAAWKPATKASP